jgi:uncharacterized SAM-binding protein YcdF (DUF218 family)
METNSSRKGSGCSSIKVLTGCGGLAVLIPLLLVVFYIGLWGLGGILVIADRLQPSNAIVVLSGGTNERIKYAAALYRDGMAEYLILTETGIRYPGNPTPATGYAIDLAVDQGVPEEVILTPETVVDSTADEALTVKRTAEASDFSRLIVVTDPYHTFRTRLIFQTVFRGSGIKVMVHPASGHWYDSSTWFLSKTGWNTTLSEYVKIIGFLLGIR